MESKQADDFIKLEIMQYLNKLRSHPKTYNITETSYEIQKEWCVFDINHLQYNMNSMTTVDHH